MGNNQIVPTYKKLSVILVVVSFLGRLQVVVIPCQKNGVELDEEYVENPDELVCKTGIIVLQFHKWINTAL